MADGAFGMTEALARETAPVWARVKDHVTPMEWPAQAALISEINALKKRNAKAQRLAGTGLSLANDVATFESHRKTHFLNRECALNAIFEEGSNDLWIGAQFREGRCARWINGG